MTTSFAEYARIPHAVASAVCKAGPAALLALLTSAAPAAPGAVVPHAVPAAVAAEPMLAVGGGDSGAWGADALGWGSDAAPGVSGDAPGLCCDAAPVQPEMGFAAGLWGWAEGSAPQGAAVPPVRIGNTDPRSPPTLVGLVPPGGDADARGAAVPEPASFGLLATAAALLGGVAWTRRGFRARSGRDDAGRRR